MNAGELKTRRQPTPDSGADHPAVIGQADRLLLKRRSIR